MVSCNLCSNVSSCSNATWQSFHILQGVQERKQVFHKETNKKNVPQKN